MKTKLLLLFLALASLSACNNDDDSNVNSCEVDDYGYLQITLPSSEFRTSILLTPVGSTTAIEEVVEAERTAATLEIDSGSYNVVVSHINERGQIVDEPIMFTLLITQCETTIKTLFTS